MNLAERERLKEIDKITPTLAHSSVGRTLGC